MDHGIAEMNPRGTADVKRVDILAESPTHSIAIPPTQSYASVQGTLTQPLDSGRQLWLRCWHEGFIAARAFAEPR
jgi:hypothetical protein